MLKDPATLGKVATFTMASTKVLFAIDIYRIPASSRRSTRRTAQRGTRAERADQVPYCAAAQPLPRPRRCQAGTVHPAEERPIKIVGCDDGAFLANNDASSATGNVGEAFTYTAKNASKKALEYFHTDTATSLYRPKTPSPPDPEIP